VVAGQAGRHFLYVAESVHAGVWPRRSRGSRRRRRDDVACSQHARGGETLFFILILNFIFSCFLFVVFLLVRWKRYMRSTAK